MYEIEIKAWLENPEEVEEKIKNLKILKNYVKEDVKIFEGYPELMNAKIKVEKLDNQTLVSLRNEIEKIIGEKLLATAINESQSNKSSSDFKDLKNKDYSFIDSTGFKELKDFISILKNKDNSEILEYVENNGIKIQEQLNELIKLRNQLTNFTLSKKKKINDALNYWRHLKSYETIKKVFNEEIFEEGSLNYIVKELNKITSTLIEKIKGKNVSYTLPRGRIKSKVKEIMINVKNFIESVEDALVEFSKNGSDSSDISGKSPNLSEISELQYLSVAFMDIANRTFEKVKIENEMEILGKFVEKIKKFQQETIKGFLSNEDLLSKINYSLSFKEISSSLKGKEGINEETIEKIKNYSIEPKTYESLLRSVAGNDFNNVKDWLSEINSSLSPTEIKKTLKRKLEEDAMISHFTLSAFKSKRFFGTISIGDLTLGDILNISFEMIKEGLDEKIVKDFYNVVNEKLGKYLSKRLSEIKEEQDSFNIKRITDSKQETIDIYGKSLDVVINAFRLYKTCSELLPWFLKEEYKNVINLTDVVRLLVPDKEILSPRDAGILRNKIENTYSIATIKSLLKDCFEKLEKIDELYNIKILSAKKEFIDKILNLKTFRSIIEKHIKNNENINYEEIIFDIS